MSTKYAKVKTHDEKGHTTTRMLSIVKEDDIWLRGWEVNREGERNHKFHLIDKKAIVSRIEYEMSNLSGELVPVQHAATSVENRAQLEARDAPVNVCIACGFAKHFRGGCPLPWNLPNALTDGVVLASALGGWIDYNAEDRQAAFRRSIRA